MKILCVCMMLIVVGLSCGISSNVWSMQGRTVLKVGLMHTFNKADPACYEQYINNLPNAVEMAWHDYAIANPKRKFNIEFIRYDYEGNKLLAPKRMKEAAHDGVIAVIGYVCSDYALLAGRVAQEVGVPLITPTATADEIARIGDYVIMACFRDSYQGEALGRFMYDSIGKRKVVVVTAIDCTYCRSLSESFKRSFTNYGGEVVVDHSILRRDVMFEDLMEKIKSQEYDSVFIPNYALQSAAIISRMIMDGHKAVYFGGDAWSWEETISQIVGDDDFVGYMSKSWAVDMPFKESKDFMRRYETKYGEPARDVAAHSYDAAMLIFEALQRAKNMDRTSVKDALKAIGVHDGVIGRMSFRGARAPKSSIVIMKLTDEGQKRFLVIQPHEDI